MERPRMDARILVWGLLIVLLSGTALMVGYAPRTQQVAPWAEWLVPAHAAATAWVVWGTLVHLIRRLASAGATRHGVKTGAWALLAVGFATVSGAFAAPVDTWQRFMAFLGDDGVLWSTVAHVAYATILVLLTVFMHVARWGWRRVLGEPVHAGMAVALTALLTVVGGTWWTNLLVPPVPVLWAWTVLLPLAVWMGSRRLARAG